MDPRRNEKFCALAEIFFIHEVFSTKIVKSILEGGVVAENFVRNHLAPPHSCVRSPANCDGGDHQVKNPLSIVDTY